MTRLGWIIAIAVAIAFGAFGWMLRGRIPTDSAVRNEGHDHEGADISHYTCPMHPSVKASEPGPCPICGMDLTPVPLVASEMAPDSTTKLSETVPGFISLTSWQQQLIGVTTAPVELKRVGATLETVGRVAYDETSLTDVNLKISGWIRKLLVDYTGKPVSKGQALFTLYSPELVSTQEEYLLALRSFQAMELKVPGAGTAGEHGSDDALGGGIRRESIERARNLLDAARRRLTLWDLTEVQIQELADSKTPRTTMTIHAPASGIVIEKMAVEGMYVKPGMRLYRIANLDTVWVLADIYEYELPFVREGQDARISLPYIPDRPFLGRVDYVYPYLDAKSRTVRVRLRVPNPNLELRPDMYADVALSAEQQVKLVVPESAVLFSGRRRIVFVALGNGRFQPREVRLGARTGDVYHVLDGLRADERVVTSANFLLDSESRLKGVTAVMLSSGS